MKRILLIAAFGLLAHLPVMAASNYVIKIDGMTCKFCAHNVKKQLKTLDGVQSVEVDQDQGLATVQVEAGTNITDAQFKSLIAEAGYNYRGTQSKPE